MIVSRGLGHRWRQCLRRAQVAAVPQTALVLDTPPAADACCRQLGVAGAPITCRDPPSAHWDAHHAGLGWNGCLVLAKLG